MFTLAAPISRRLCAWESTKVRLTKDARQCVVYLGHADSDGEPSSFVPSATGFFVSEPGHGYGHPGLYLVTAAHVVHKLEDGCPFHIRYNTEDAAKTVRIESPQWLLHPDENVDVALLRIERSEFNDLLSLPRRSLLAYPHESDIGPGDQIYTVGLFNHLATRARNVPLVHLGHIAAEPDGIEPIQIRNWRTHEGLIDVEAYIVQCPVVEGASGSPVFVRKSIDVPPLAHRHGASGITLEPEHMPPAAFGQVVLLGVWHSSWEVRADGIRSPMGYGVVFPAQRILEIMDTPEEKKRRAHAYANRKLPGAGAELVLDALPSAEQDARFETTVKAMLESPPQPRKRSKDA